MAVPGRDGSWSCIPPAQCAVGLALSLAGQGVAAHLQGRVGWTVWCQTPPAAQWHTLYRCEGPGTRQVVGHPLGYPSLTAQLSSGSCGMAEHLGEEGSCPAHDGVLGGGGRWYRGGTSCKWECDQKLGQGQGQARNCRACAGCAAATRGGGGWSGQGETWTMAGSLAEPGGAPATDTTCPVPWMGQPLAPQCESSRGGGYVSKEPLLRDGRQGC